MIVSFADGETRMIFLGQPSRKLPLNIQRTARRKLLIINRASDLRDLRSVPGNRLEVLKGDRKGQHSIRINDQWRICFAWIATPSSGDEDDDADRNGGNAHDVEIVDYH